MHSGQVVFYGDYVPLLLATAVMFSCLCTWLTVYIEIQLFVNCYHGNK